jgi:hypothetical protein
MSLFFMKHRVVHINGIDSGRHANDRGVKLARILTKEVIAAAYAVTPAASASDFASPFYKSHNKALCLAISQPDGIVEVIDDFTSEYFRDQPFKNRWSDRGSFAVDKDEIARANAWQDSQSPQKSNAQSPQLSQAVTGFVKHPPLAIVKEGLNFYSISLLLKQPKILLEAKTLGGRFADGIGDKKKDPGDHQFAFGDFNHFA